MRLAGLVDDDVVAADERCRVRVEASGGLLQAGDQPVELGGRVKASEAPVEVGRGLSGFGGLVLFFHGVFLSVFRISVRA